MAVGDVLFATISVALLIRTLVRGEASLLLIVEVESLLASCWLTPVGKRRGVILLALSGSLPFPGGDTRSHGSYSLSLGSISFVNFAAERRASMTLSNRAPGWFDLAMRGLTCGGTWRGDPIFILGDVPRERGQWQQVPCQLASLWCSRSALQWPWLKSIEGWD